MNHKTKQSPCKVCIISDKPPAYSETFIQAHIERLPVKTVFLYGSRFPVHQVNGKAIVPNSLFHRVMRRISRKIFKQSASISDQNAFKYFLKKEKVDAILAEYGSTGIAVQDVCQAMNIPLVVHFHGYDAYSKKVIRKIGNRYPRLFQNASAVIAVSKHMEEQLVKLGASPDKIYYSPYGVDLSNFNVTNPSDNPITFLAVGRFIEKKAPHLTIKAFSKVVKKVPEAKLQMIGDGALLGKCKDLVKSLHISHKVQFLGACSHEEVTNRMQTVRAFVQHSIQASNGDCEGTPVAILEAQASGLPIIATRHTGIMDVVLEEETGVLCYENDIDKMAENMVRIAENPQLAFKLGQAGREQVANKFSMEISLERLTTIIEDLVYK